MATQPSNKHGAAENTDDLAKKVASAEAAVAAVKDPELKRVAFEKVLERLLGSAPAQGQRHDRPATALSKSTPNQPKRNGGPTTYVRELVDDGFFTKPKTIGDVRSELAARGHHVPLTSLSGPMQTLCKARVLRRQLQPANGNKDAKKIYSYSKW